MLYWSAFPAPDDSSSLRQATETTQFLRLFERYPNNTLFGTMGLHVQDTAQSRYLGDCYFIAGVVSYLNAKPESFKKVFVV